MVGGWVGYTLISLFISLSLIHYFLHGPIKRGRGGTSMLILFFNVNLYLSGAKKVGGRQPPPPGPS